MKTGRALFVSAAAFGIVIAIAYWLIARDPAGTTLLAFMGAALTVVAGYMFVAQRHANLSGDDPDATMQGAAGEHVGTYVTDSPAPFGIGVALTAIVLGFVVSPAAAGIGLMCLFVLGAIMIVRSR